MASAALRGGRAVRRTSGTRLCVRRNTTADTWARVREAIELVGLLARVDACAAWQLLGADNGDHERLPGFELGLDCDWLADPTTRTGVLGLVANSAPRAAASAQFAHVEAQLLLAWTRLNNGRVFSREFNARVPVTLEFTLRSTNASAFNVLHTLASSRPQRGIKINAFGFRILDWGSTSMFQQLNVIAATGMPVHHLCIVALANNRLDAAVLNRFLRDQFEQRNSGVQTLEIRARAFDIAAMEALCAAIGQSLSLRSLRFDVGNFIEEQDELSAPARGEIWWPCLAYALFSGHTRHAIQDIRLDTSSLTLHDIVAVGRALGGRVAHPVRHLTLDWVQLQGELALPILGLLEMIGLPLERLEIRSAYTQVASSNCVAVWKACPSLLRLDIACELDEDSVDWLVSPPATSTLQTLRLYVANKGGNGLRSWSRLWSALSDSKHPLTASLREFRVTFGPESNERSERVIVEGCSAMLVKNTLLQRCELLQCNAATKHKNEASFLAHDGTPLHCTETLAFLSAIAVGSVRAVTDLLPPEMVALVFAFAGREHRVCIMT